MTQTQNTDKVTQTFLSILDNLSDKEKDVILRRIGLNWEKETLQNIGDSFNITRERVRQIEDSWIKKLGRIVKTTDLIYIQNKARELLWTHGWVLSKERIINAIINELELPKWVDAWIISVIIQSDYDIKKSKPKLGITTYFFLPQISTKRIQTIHDELVRSLKKKKDVMDIQGLCEFTKINSKSDLSDLNAVLVDSVIDIYDDLVKWEEILVALSSWKILNPKTLKDKSIYVLKREKVPMHFVDIANKISQDLWETVKVNTVHNELIRNTEFVLIGRWIYALKEWGFKPWTVIDVIVEVMKKINEPMSTEDIIKKVLKIRDVKPTTIYMNLQNRDVIERVWRNFYKLK